MSDTNTKVIVGTAVAVGTVTAASLAYFYATKKNEPIPTKWKKVGELIDMNCFFVKSCAPVKCETAYCHELGLQYEGVFERCLVISQNNKQATARGYPKMVLIQSKLIGKKLILSAPEKSDFILNLDELREGRYDQKIQLWFHSVGGIDAGDEVSDWLSEYIVGKKGVFRLIFYPHLYAAKKKGKCDNKYKAYINKDTGAYHDTTSYMLINQASIDELNTHLDHVVKPLQFRPNIVIKGPGAYAEDNFKWARIGDNAIFRGIKPCHRCIFTCINPETAERHPKRQPLETLKKTRTIIPNESPVMGLHLGIRVPGQISIGDAVYINDEETA